MDFLQLINQYGDKETVEKIRQLVDNLKSEVDHKILDQANKRSLTENEVSFLRSMRPVKRARSEPNYPQIEEIKDEPSNKIISSTCGLEHRLSSLNLNH